MLNFGVYKAFTVGHLEGEPQSQVLGTYDHHGLLTWDHPPSSDGIRGRFSCMLDLTDKKSEGKKSGKLNSSDVIEVHQ